LSRSTVKRSDYGAAIMHVRRAWLTTAAVAGLLGAVLLALIVLGHAPEPPQVVAIQVRPPAAARARATGVVVGDDRVLTVAHVLAQGGRVVVRGRDGVPRRGTILRRDPHLDLAVLAVRGLRADRVRVGDGGSDLRVLLERDGAVQARAAHVQRRIMARLVDQAGAPVRPTLELAAEVEPGDSGAPVVDGEGRVVGLVYALSTRRARTAYAVRGPGLATQACGDC